MSKPRVRLSALALAAAVTLGFATPDALALALGRVNVLSALGEPLRADIEVPEINPEEVASLRATIAPPAVFQAAGMEVSPSLQGVNISLQRRTNGSYFLRLTSDRPVNDPFVDVILEASWASGRVQRDFTLLFDPPNMRQGSPSADSTLTRPRARARASGVAKPNPRLAHRCWRPHCSIWRQSFSLHAAHRLEAKIEKGP